MKHHLILTVTFSFLFFACSFQTEKIEDKKVRGVADTIGFAHLSWQVDSVISRINLLQAEEINKSMVSPEIFWRTAICPHDDYTYVGWHYPAILRNLKAKTIIIFGVAHRAKQFGLADKLVFESFDSWQGPYGELKISWLRNEIIENLSNEMLTVHDSIHIVEHSVESMLPFLQYYNREVEIVPILVPHMSYERMQEISKFFAGCINQLAEKHNLIWGIDFALLITTDAVHYGDEEWGGRNYAPYGVDSLGYLKAVEHDYEIINSCLLGELTEKRINKFFGYTVDPNDYMEYQWTWCGRYCVPFGLLTSLHLNSLIGYVPLVGHFIGYTNSIDHEPIPVEDLWMGRTAIATQRHWVGYASIGFE
jgi:AmmeMemoRadiSam system protein B